MRCQPIGVGWACQLFADLIEHWERRGKEGLEYMDPKKLDRPLLAQLVDKYGYQDIAEELRKRDGWPNPADDELDGGVPVHDDYAACQIIRKEDWVDLFVKPFYFGCEAPSRIPILAPDDQRQMRPCRGAERHRRARLGSHPDLASAV
jgi:hypothetical protein